MGTLSSIRGAWIATWSGIRHVFKPRMTLRYPDQKLDLQGPGYHFDPKNGVGLPGFKGRHILREEKCTGCQLCAIACDGVAVAIEMQTMVRNRPQNKKNYWPAVDYGRCVPPWTLVVTSKGIVPIEEIHEGDQVLTHAGRFRNVTEVFRRKHTGRTYTFKMLGNAEPLTVTEGHPILVQRPEGLVWVMPDQIRYRDYLVRPVIKNEQVLPDLEYAHEQYHPAGRGGYLTVEGNTLSFTPELARLIGYYLSEGFADRYRVSFDINKHEEALAADIISCTRAVFGREYVAPKPDQRSDGLKLVVDSVRIAAFFKQFGDMCDKKVLPPWALTIPRELQGQLVKAAYLGDGHYSNKFYENQHSMHSNYFVIRTTSRALANQYTYMLDRLGIVSSVCTNRQKDRKLCYSVTIHTPYVEKMSELTGVPAKNSPSFAHSYIKMTDDAVFSPVVKITIEDVKDFDVLNLEVEDDNTYVASNQIVHNCVFCGLCIDPNTPVVTNPSLKRMSAISVGDMVLTHRGEYKPVTKVWDMRYTGTLYRIYVYGKPEPLVCTADHPIIAVSRPKSNKKDGRLLRSTKPLKFYTPGELKPGDYLVSPIVKKELLLDTYQKEVSMYKLGLVKKKLVLDASPELFRLIGFYLAEGSCDGGRRVNFDFNVTETHTLVADCNDLLEKFFRKRGVLKRNGENGIRVCINSAIAEDFFSQFGRGAPNKRLPDWVFFAERKKILEVMKGEWQGDGCRVKQARQKYLNFTMTSEILAFQIQQLLAKVGVVATIEREEPENKLPSYHVDVFGRWAIKLAAMWNVEFDYHPTKHVDKFHISEDYVYLPIRKIETTEVTDYRVMDVTVDGDHTFSPLGLATSNCVDACPFDALSMSNDYELSAYDKASLKYTPDMLMIPPPEFGTAKVKFDPKRGNVTHG
jgi:formate hydrogenlyase subunit 6/NADH:ubiquinone oxidoreductase subunit I/intein/homing endonuclease